MSSEVVSRECKAEKRLQFTGVWHTNLKSAAAWCGECKAEERLQFTGSLTQRLADCPRSAQPAGSEPFWSR